MLSTEFLITSLVVVLLPGTGVIFTVATGLSLGRRASLFAAAGCTLGIIPHLLASIFGLAALLHTSSLAFQLFKYAGVIYLLYLAWGMWKETGSIRFDGSGSGSGTAPAQDWRIAMQAMLINVLNPKLSIFFLAFLPQFLPTATATPLADMLILSLTFMLMTLLVFIGYGLFAHHVKHYIQHSPTILTWLQRSFAGIFVALSARLASSEQ
ncbi:LysE family translocator [Aliamphritea spongicola]|uniref:LysE family translocator n=1 Tax=Aliamphritea spongicola TaxID=707589 RepID=UPI00196B5ADA|nr:LysE family translocator [Aliamphritea spongicola]MBN3561796.1 LysE family translocator [Aliamphritea spongicola]